MKIQLTYESAVTLKPVSESTNVSEMIRLEMEMMGAKGWQFVHCFVDKDNYLHMFFQRRVTE